MDNKKKILIGSGIFTLLIVIIVVYLYFKKTEEESPMEEEPAQEESPMEESPMEEEPAQEDSPMEEDPMEEEPVAEDPIEEDPMEEEPVAEDPIEEDPIEEDPVAEEVVTEEKKAILDTPQQNITLDEEEVEPENNNNDEEQEEAKKETVVPIPIDNNNYTKFYNNDWEHGDKQGSFRRTVFLDGHNVNCGTDNFIKNFALQEDEQKKNYRYQYLCDTKVEGFSNYNSKENYENALFEGPKKHHTEFNEEGSGDVAYLDRHDVRCEGLVNQFQLNRKDGKYRYSYSCYEPPSSSWKLITESKTTKKIKKNSLSSQDLLHAQIKCGDPNDKDVGLVGFRYNAKGYYDYACGKIVKKTEEELEKERKANGIGELAFAEIWKNAGCTTKKKYNDWHKTQTKKQLIADSKLWATKSDEEHKKGCYGQAGLVAFANENPPIGSGPYLHKATGITYQVSSSHNAGKGKHFTPWIDSHQGWSAGKNDQAQTLNMKFKKQFVKNVMIQGRIDGSHSQYLQSFNLYYKNANDKWVFVGRKYPTTKNNIIYDIPINVYTQEIQLNVVKWNKHITFRAGLKFGSEKKDKPKSFKLLFNGQRIKFATAHHGYYIKGFSDGTVGWGGKDDLETTFIAYRITKNKDLEGKWAFYNQSHKRYLKAGHNHSGEDGRVKKMSLAAGERNNFEDLPEDWTYEAFTVVDAGNGQIGLLTHHFGWVGISNKGKSYQGKHWEDIYGDTKLTSERFTLTDGGGNVKDAAKKVAKKVGKWAGIGGKHCKHLSKFQDRQDCQEQNQNVGPPNLH